MSPTASKWKGNAARDMTTGIGCLVCSHCRDLGLSLCEIKRAHECALSPLIPSSPPPFSLSLRFGFPVLPPILCLLLPLSRHVASRGRQKRGIVLLVYFIPLMTDDSKAERDDNPKGVTKDGRRMRCCRVAKASTSSPHREER